MLMMPMVRLVVVEGGGGGWWMGRLSCRIAARHHPDTCRLFHHGLVLLLAMAEGRQRSCEKSSEQLLLVLIPPKKTRVG
jgi:hypothetical protein